MLKFDNIKNKLKDKINLQENWWVALNWFDENDKLLFSKWIIFSDEKRSINLKKLFDDFVLPNKKVKILVIDFIENIKEIKSANEIKNLNLLEDWLFLWDIKNDNWSFILPNTKWVNNFTTWLKAIKEKVQFSSNNVNVFTFKTKRFTIED